VENEVPWMVVAGGKLFEVLLLANRLGGTEFYTLTEPVHKFFLTTQKTNIDWVELYHRPGQYVTRKEVPSTPRSTCQKHPTLYPAL